MGNKVEIGLITPRGDPHAGSRTVLDSGLNAWTKIGDARDPPPVARVMRSRAMLVRSDERIIRNSAIPRRKKGEIHVREVPRMKRQPHDRIRRIATLRAPTSLQDFVGALSFFYKRFALNPFTVFPSHRVAIASVDFDGSVK